MDAKNKKNKSPAPTENSSREINSGLVTPNANRDLKSLAVSEFGDSATLNRVAVRKNDIQVQVESATVPRRSSKANGPSNGSHNEFVRLSAERASGNNQQKSVGAQASGSSVAASDNNGSRSQFQSMGSAPDSVFADEITEVEISDFFDSDILSGEEECDGANAAGSLVIDEPPPCQRTIYAEYTHNIVIDYSTILEKNVKMKENIEALASSGKTQSVMKSLLQRAKKDKHHRRARSVDPPAAPAGSGAAASDTPGSKSKGLMASLLKHLSPNTMRRKGSKKEKDKADGAAGHEPRSSSGDELDEQTGAGGAAGGNGSGGVLRERNGSVSSADNTSGSSRRASAASSATPSPLLNTLSRDGYQKLLLIKDNQRQTKDKSVYSSFKEKQQQPSQQQLKGGAGKESLTPKLALRAVEFPNGGAVGSATASTSDRPSPSRANGRGGANEDRQSPLPSAGHTSQTTVATTTTTDGFIPSIQSSDLSCNDPDFTTGVHPRERVLVPLTAASVEAGVGTTTCDSVGDCSLSVSADSDQAIVGPRPAVCSWSQNGVTVKETKSGQVTSYVSDVPSNNSLVASDAPLQVAPSQTRATPPRSSTGVEQTTSPGALVTPPSPKVPSYVRVAASASGYSGYSSYSSLPRPAKARLSPAPASSPPQNSPGAPSPAERPRSAGEPRLPTAADHVDGCDVVVSRAKTEERDVKDVRRSKASSVSSRPASSRVSASYQERRSVVEPTTPTTSNSANTDLSDTLEKDGHYYLKLLEEEKTSLEALCRRTEADLAIVPEDVSGRLWSAIGKATLLTTSKFKQCRELCHQNIHGPSTPDQPPTLASDLEGYWELVANQLREVHDMFTDIERLRNNHWIDDSPPPPPLSPPTSPIRKAPVKKTVAARVKVPRRAAGPRKSESGGDDVPVIIHSVPRRKPWQKEPATPAATAAAAAASEGDVIGSPSDGSVMAVASSTDVSSLNDGQAEAVTN